MIEKRYFGGWEVDFSNENTLTSFLLTHGTDKKGFNFFKKVQGALEFQINGNRVDKVFQCDEEGRELIAEDVYLPVESWEEHQVFYLMKEKGGMHRLGGEKPEDLILPFHENMKTPFYYLGTIDGTYPSFQWMGLSQLDIVFPLYECSFGVFLDYTNPKHPQIINPDTFTDDWDTGDIPKDITFTETRFNYSNNIKKLTDKVLYDLDDYLICGIPLWYQEPEIPRCPKTGEVMRFVCTINSDESIDASTKENIEIPDDHLNFGDNGHLFVFYHPESKVLHLNVQW